MSNLTTPSSCFYFLSVIYRSDLFDETTLIDQLPMFKMDSSLKFIFPKVDASYRLLEYYKKEMGEPLQRVLYASLIPCERDEFAALKIRATAIEKEHSYESKRKLNIDVGQVNLENMQLASGKSYSHRVYIRDGVYSDLHYQFKNSSYEALPWCYPDYAQFSVIEFFNHLRSLLLLSHNCP